nr:Rv0909 family putative TA system antitoxin [Arsenicicoccus piscis]
MRRCSSPARSWLPRAVTPPRRCPITSRGLATGRFGTSRLLRTTAACTIEQGRNTVDLNNIINQAKDYAGKNPDQVRAGLDRVREQIDQRTGGKYGEQIDQGVDQIEKQLGLPQDQQPGDQGAQQPQPEEPTEGTQPTPQQPADSQLPGEPNQPAPQQSPRQTPESTPQSTPQQQSPQQQGSGNAAGADQAIDDVLRGQEQQQSQQNQ